MACKYTLFRNFPGSGPWSYNLYSTRLHARIARYRICGSSSVNTKFLEIKRFELNFSGIWKKC